MNLGNIWWFLARSSGLVAAVLIAGAFVWGILLSTRLLSQVTKPAWLLDLHRWLGSLALAFVGLHLVSLVADSYTHFDIASLLVPFASEWRPGPVAWGVVALYVLIAIQVTSSNALRSRLPRKWWHGVHLLSILMVWLVAVHAGTAGTDVGNPLYGLTMVGLILVGAFTVTVRVVAGTRRSPKLDTGAPSRSVTSRPVAAERRRSPQRRV